MQDGRKAVWRIPYVSVAAFFPSLKQNFIAYCSSKVFSCPDCIFEIHQLWQSGFSRVYSNCCCSCSFEPELIKIVQSSYKIYINNIVNFQESTPIFNACTKMVWKLIECTTCIFVWMDFALNPHTLFIMWIFSSIYKNHFLFLWLQSYYIAIATKIGTERDVCVCVCVCCVCVLCCVVCVCCVCVCVVCVCVCCVVLCVCVCVVCVCVLCCVVCVCVVCVCCVCVVLCCVCVLCVCVCVCVLCVCVVCVCVLCVCVCVCVCCVVLCVCVCVVFLALNNLVDMP